MQHVTKKSPLKINYQVINFKTADISKPPKLQTFAVIQNMSSNTKLFMSKNNHHNRSSNKRYSFMTSLYFTVSRTSADSTQLSVEHS